MVETWQVHKVSETKLQRIIGALLLTFEGGFDEWEVIIKNVGYIKIDFTTL